MRASSAVRCSLAFSAHISPCDRFLPNAGEQQMSSRPSSTQTTRPSSTQVTCMIEVWLEARTWGGPCMYGGKLVCFRYKPGRPGGALSPGGPAVHTALAAGGLCWKDSKGWQGNPRAGKVGASLFQKLARNLCARSRVLRYVFLFCLVVNQEHADSLHLQNLLNEASVQLLGADEIQR